MLMFDKTTNRHRGKISSLFFASTPSPPHFRYLFDVHVQALQFTIKADFFILGQCCVSYIIINCLLDGNGQSNYTICYNIYPFQSIYRRSINRLEVMHMVKLDLMTSLHSSPDQTILMARPLCTYQCFPPEKGGRDYPRELDNFEKLGSDSLPMWHTFVSKIS